MPLRIQTERSFPLLLLVQLSWLSNPTLLSLSGLHADTAYSIMMAGEHSCLPPVSSSKIFHDLTTAVFCYFAFLFNFLSSCFLSHNYPCKFAFERDLGQPPNAAMFHSKIETFCPRQFMIRMEMPIEGQLYLCYRRIFQRMPQVGHLLLHCAEHFWS